MNTVKGTHLAEAEFSLNHREGGYYPDLCICA